MASDEYLHMNRDDERASRIFALVVRFLGASAPLAADDLHAEFYADLSQASFERVFSRDRIALASTGLVLQQIDRSHTGQLLWRVDEQASYSEGMELAPDDALVLAILCHDLTRNPSFAWRGELRMAMAKIGSTYQAVATLPGEQADPLCLRTLVGCQAHRHMAEVVYRRADGASSTRTLALYGSFGFRQHSYFVALRTDVAEDHPKTYRLDRFVRARELTRRSYDIPEDFDIDDFRKLPFQIGTTVCACTFEVPDHPTSEVARAMSSKGETSRDKDRTLWRVPVSDVRLAAAWAVGEGLRPVSPVELTQHWHDIVESAAQLRGTTLADGPLSDTSQQARRTPGRKGSADEARQLVSLINSLMREGRTITAADIASTLGISISRARHIIAILSMSFGESIDYLPVVVSDADDEISLMEGSQFSPRHIRLTPTETHALVAALSELGIPADDPLRRMLEDSYGTPSIDRADVLRTLGHVQGDPQTDLLGPCSAAIAQGRTISFFYDPISGGPSLVRHVHPERCRRGENGWYLDAYDLDRQGERVFRFDRMSQLETGEVQKRAHTPQRKRREHLREERVLFKNPQLLDLFAWDHLHIVAQDETGVWCVIPHYQGPWLARHLAACAADICCEPAMAEEVRAAARAARA